MPLPTKREHDDLRRLLLSNADGFTTTLPLTPERLRHLGSYRQQLQRLFSSVGLIVDINRRGTTFELRRVSGPPPIPPHLYCQSVLNGLRRNARRKRALLPTVSDDGTLNVEAQPVSAQPTQPKPDYPPTFPLIAERLLNADMVEIDYSDFRDLNVYCGREHGFSLDFCPISGTESCYVAFLEPIPANNRYGTPPATLTPPLRAFFSAHPGKRLLDDQRFYESQRSNLTSLTDEETTPFSE